MSLRFEEPKVTKTTNSYREGEVEITHPAFATIGLSRCTCSPSIELFGSNVKHSTFIKLEIKEAKKYTDGYSEHIFGNKTICEVILSGNQLGDLLSSMNVGSGVPCTLQRRETNWDIPMIKNQENPVDESRKVFKERLAKLAEKSIEAANKADKILSSKKPITKKEMEEVKSYLYKIKQELNSNIPYMNTCFEEKVETTISHAKSEVDSFVQTVINHAGLNAIKNGIVELPYEKVTLLGEE